MFGREIAPGDVVLFPSTIDARIGAIMDMDSSTCHIKPIDIESHEPLVMDCKTLTKCIRVQSACEDDLCPLREFYLREYQTAEFQSSAGKELRLGKLVVSATSESPAGGLDTPLVMAWALDTGSDRIIATTVAFDSATGAHSRHVAWCHGGSQRICPQSLLQARSNPVCDQNHQMLEPGDFVINQHCLGVVIDLDPHRDVEVFANYYVPGAHGYVSWHANWARREDVIQVSSSSFAAASAGEFADPQWPGSCY